MKNILFFLPLTSVLAGCWTFNESAYPETAMTPLANTATNRSVRVAGFESFFTQYDSVEGFQTVYVPGYYGYRHFRPGHFETVHSVTYVPQHRSSDMFLKRAQDMFEKAGFTLGGEKSVYTVEVTFDGPLNRMEDDVAKACWILGTVFFCSYDADHWSAKLRIRETASGKLLFHHDYTQDYETNVFGLIPLFGIASCEKTSPYTTQTWCLAALTDRALADATAYLSGLK